MTTGARAINKRHSIGSRSILFPDRDWPRLIRQIESIKAPLVLEAHTPPSHRLHHRDPALCELQLQTRAYIQARMRIVCKNLFTVEAACRLFAIARANVISNGKSERPKRETWANNEGENCAGRETERSETQKTKKKTLWNTFIEVDRHNRPAFARREIHER